MISEYFPLEAMAAKPHKKLTGVEWAEKYRVLTTESSAFPGPFRADIVKITAGVLNAACHKNVSKLTWVAGTQIGKTETILNSLGYIITESPASIMLVYPEKEDALSMGSGRLKDMIDNARDNILKERVDLSNKRSKKYEVPFLGGVLYLAWATNVNRLSSRPVKYLFLDEIDKYPAHIPGHGSPLSLVQDRKKSFANSKIIMASTPTFEDGAIWQSFQTSDYKFYYKMQCSCGERLTFDIINLSADESGVYYSCPYCSKKYRDKDKPALISNGAWISEDNYELEEVLNFGHKLNIGFHANSFYAPALSFTDIYNQNKKMMKNSFDSRVFINGWLGLPFSEDDLTGADFEIDKLMERVEDYEELPAGVLALTCGVDVQKNRLEYLVIGWGLNRESWVVDKGIIIGDTMQEGVWSELDLIVVHKKYKHKKGIELKIMVTFVDSGFNTNMVYAYTKRRESLRVFSIKGANRSDAVEVSTPKRSGFERALRYDLGVHSIKQNIYYFLSVQEQGAGYMHFKNKLCDKAFFEQLTAERLVIKNEHGKKYEAWEKIRERNEVLDMYCYCYAALSLILHKLPAYAAQLASIGGKSF